MLQTVILKDGTEVTIREAVIADAPGILQFAHELFATTDSVLTTAPEFTVTQQQEEAFIAQYAASPTALVLVAVRWEQVIGLLDFRCHPKVKMSHTGEFGVSVHSAYRGQGIGRSLVAALIGWAHTVPQVEKLVLKVMHTNEGAINLYESLGFITEGREVKVIKQPDGSYADLLVMGMFVPSQVE